MSWRVALGFGIWGVVVVWMGMYMQRDDRPMDRFARQFAWIRDNDEAFLGWQRRTGAAVVVVGCLAVVAGVIVFVRGLIN